MDVADLAFGGAAEQARMLAAASITAPALLEIYLERIARLDPRLRSYRVVLAESARHEALAAQRRLDAGERLPLLLSLAAQIESARPWAQHRPPVS